MVFGRKRGRDDDDDELDEEEELDLILFQGAVNGVEANLKANARLARAGLVPAKQLISDGVARRAHTIIVEPRGERAAIRFVIDGIPYPGGALPGKRALAVIQMVKLLAGLDVNDRSVPQSGGIHAEFQEQPYVLHVDTTPGRVERLRIRVDSVNDRIRKPDDAGFTQDLRSTIRRLATQQRGVLLVCGAPESGTTTTTHVVVHTVDSYLYTVFSLADVGTHELTNIAEFKGEEGHDLELTLDRVLRKEANVIFIDPLTDPETTQLIFDYQKKVTFFAEFPAADPVSALQELISWVGADVVAEGLLGIVTQKLCRRLCDPCKEAYRPNPKLLRKIGLPPETKVLYRAPAPDEDDPNAPTVEELCEDCSGLPYHGRVGMYELIEITDGMKEVILEGADPTAIAEQIRTDEMLTLQKDGLRLVAEGTTSLEELQRTFAGPRKKRPGRRRRR